MTSLVDRLSDAELRRLADRFTRLGVFPSGFRAPSSPPVIATGANVGPVALDYTVPGVPHVFAKENTTRRDRITDISSITVALASAGLPVAVKTGALHRVRYVLQPAGTGGVETFGAFSGPTFAEFVALFNNGDAFTPGAPLRSTAYATPFALPSGAPAYIDVLILPTANGVLDLLFRTNSIGPTVTLQAGSYVDAWRLDPGVS